LVELTGRAFMMGREVDSIRDSLYSTYTHDNGDTFATYVLEFDTSIPLIGATFDEDLIGKELIIMGNEFTVGEVSDDGSDNLDKLVLIGGSNKIAIGEGETTSVKVDGKDYEVSVQSVNDEEVLLSINGNTVSIDEYDTEDILGINIAVTDLVDSDRDSVKGYAELVVGGQKVTLETGNIEINDEELDDIFDEYDIDVVFSGIGMETITITYKVDDNTLLQKGDSLMDVLFDTFELKYEGTNEPDYTEFTISTTDEEIQFSGTLENGEDFPDEWKMYYTTDGVIGGDLYVGDDDYRFFFDSANNVPHAADGVLYNATHLTFDVTDIDIKDYGLFYAQDLDDQFLYEITSVDDTDKEVDFDELIEDKSNAEVDVGIDEWDTDLEDGATYFTSNTTTLVRIDYTSLGTAIMSLDGFLLIDFTDSEDAALTGTADASFVLQLDNTESGVDGDDAAEEDDKFTIDISFPTDVDDSLDIQIDEGNSDEESLGSLADAIDGTDDNRVYVTQYGLMATVDNDEFDTITIGVPEDQVYANVALVFGEGGSTSSMIESFETEAEADARAEELEDDGYDVSVEESANEAVSFDVSAVTLDSDVTGTDDLIVVGGPAVNTVAADLLGLSFPSIREASGLSEGEAVIRFFEDENSVLVYGWESADTQSAATKLNNGGLSGDEVQA